MTRPLAILPLKAFDRAKERLDLDPSARAALAEETASVVARACAGVGLDLTVVTGDHRVSRWARAHGARTIPDPGFGLNAAAGAGVAAAAEAGRAWLVLHGDLPLLRAEDLIDLTEAIEAGVAVLAPSRDGGTNVLGSQRPVPLRYGPGSFVRHLAVTAGIPRLVVVRAGTAVEIDTVGDLLAAARLRGGAWLERFLS